MAGLLTHFKTDYKSDWRRGDKSSLAYQHPPPGSSNEITALCKLPGK